MCSIEEAWAGQTFDGYRVQSQADLRRKYMPISDDMLSRNNDFSVAKKEPVSRMNNQGINTKMVRPLQVGSSSSSNASQQGVNDNMMSVSFAANQPIMDKYSGIEPRPGYMSIYDNANTGIPMPSQTQPASRNGFGDINQAFQVSPILEQFAARDNNSNSLINENSNDDQLVLYKKFNRTDSNNDSGKQILEAHIGEIQTSLKDILARIDRVERELHNNSTRNMYDMALYILVGMLIAFILYSFLRK